MKRKITAVLLCVALLLTLSVNISAETPIVTSTQPTIQESKESSIMPRAETTSIVNNGVYLIKNVASGKYLNLHYGNDADGTNIYQWTKDGSTEQKWRISYNYATQAYQIYSMSSSGGKNRVLDVYDSGGNLVSGANVKLHTPTEPASQEIDFVLVASGKYKIVMKNNMNMCLSSYGTSNGTSGGTTSTSAGNVFISTYTGSDNQKWMFEYTGTKVTVAPGGWIDSVSSTAISGWAWRSDLKNSPISVSFDIIDGETGETYYQSCIANIYRQDLYNAGYGNGYHGFRCEIDWSTFMPGNYIIRAYVIEDGTTYNLSGSPKTYTNESRIGYKGYAAYRDLSFNIDGIFVDWHAGLMNGYYPADSLSVIHVDKDSDYNLITTDNWSGFVGNQTYRGIYAPRDELTDYERSQVIILARELRTKDIGYTVTHQLDAEYPSNATKIEPEHIVAMRCDGLVEYCYEYFGHRIFGDNELWDISMCSQDNLSHHNALNILPKSQAQDYMVLEAAVVPTE